MSVVLSDRQEAIPIEEASFLREVTTVAEAAGWKGELSLVLVTDAEIRELNREFLDHDWATDVIAFPLEEDEAEVVVSAERAVAEAEDRGVEPMAELMLYVVHGILHLTGYDDHEEGEARRMHAASLKLLRSIGYRNKIAAPNRGDVG
jgi:probable rRNA maturation factor